MTCHTCKASVADIFSKRLVNQIIHSEKHALDALRAKMGASFILARTLTGQPGHPAVSYTWRNSIGLKDVPFFSGQTCRTLQYPAFVQLSWGFINGYIFLIFLDSRHSDVEADLARGSVVRVVTWPMRGSCGSSQWDRILGIEIWL